MTLAAAPISVSVLLEVSSYSYSSLLVRCLSYLVLALLFSPSSSSSLAAVSWLLATSEPGSCFLSSSAIYSGSLADKWTWEPGWTECHVSKNFSWNEELGLFSPQEGVSRKHLHSPLRRQDNYGRKRDTRFQKHLQFVANLHFDRETQLG